MITEKTVLILGAGASIPYGFPSGLELLTTICNKLRKGQMPADAVYRELLDEIGFSQTQIDSFRDDLFRCGKTSVDEFLEYRPDLMEIGKHAIAEALIPNENIDSLYIDKSDANWYQYLFKQMATSFDDFEKNSISFVTFNYDRSLEYFLAVALMSSYNKKFEEVSDKLNKIKIVHLHGQLGLTPWQDKIQNRGYTGQLTEMEIVKAAKNIKILHEGIDNTKEFEEAHNLLISATRIFFLGFGFHPTNLKRLRIPTNTNHVLIGGTMIGISDPEKKKVYKNIGITENVVFRECDIVSFFRQHIPLA